jgi:hypothetical protein
MLREGGERDVEFGHIGHFKKGSESDEYRIKIIQAIANGKV